ncbi:MAG: hypothetical protein ACK4PI_08030 [Tepidisphaerales bacterium]
MVHAAQTSPLPGEVVRAQAVNVALAAFRPLRDDPHTAWLGEGIQQALLAGLSDAPSLRLLVLDPTVVNDPAVLAAARTAGAQVVVLGTFQTAGREVRAVGRVLLTSGALVGVASARATLDELSGLQDELVRQVRAMLVAAPADAAVGAPPAAGQGPTPWGGAGAGPAAAPPVSAPPRPFEGSALQRALADEDAGRRVRTPPPLDPSRGGGRSGGLVENPGGWGSGPVPGTWGGGWGYAAPGYWGYVPLYVPPWRPPATGGGTAPGSPGGGSPLDGGTAPAPATPPATPARPPLVYPGMTPPPNLPPGLGQP